MRAAGTGRSTWLPLRFSAVLLPWCHFLSWLLTHLLIHLPSHLSLGQVASSHQLACLTNLHSDCSSFAEGSSLSWGLALQLSSIPLLPSPTSEFERRQARPADASAARGGEETNDMQQKLEEVRQPPPRVRPVPSLVPRPPQTSLVKFVGNIYTLKCRYEAPGGGREATLLELVYLEPLNSTGAAWGLERKP